MWNFFLKFRQIDRRIIYALVFLVVGLPLIFKVPIPIFPSPEARKLKDLLDAMPREKLVIIAADWQAGTKGECNPLTAAMIEYLMRRKQPFAIFSFVPQGPELAQRIAETAAATHHRKYGEDWVNWGFRPSSALQSILMSINKDIPGTIGTDIHKTPLEKIPCMKGIKSLSDVGLVYEVTGSALTDAYLQFVTRAPLALGCTAVIGPEQYPYLQSGQWKGLLVGLRGAAEFETLIGFKEGLGMKLMSSQSFAHLLIIVLIIMGNLGMVAAKKLGVGERPPPTEAGQESAPGAGGDET